MRKRHIALIGLSIFAVAIAYSRWLYAPCDDAYIFLVYARNFVEGRGLTYNGALVEGYTSPLWAWTLALLGLTHIPLPMLAEGLSTLTGLIALAATYALARAVTGSARLAVIPPLLLALTGDFAFYMGVGLEQVLFAGLVAACVRMGCYGAPRRIWILPATMTLTILVRPEGALIAALVFAIASCRPGGFDLSIRQGAILCLLVAPLPVARRIVYGYWLPNTYYVKSGMGLANFHYGVEYLLASGMRYGPLAVVLAALCVWALFANRKRLVDVLPLLAICAIWLVYIAIQGGDNMAGGRMILPILPLAFAALAALSGGLERRPAFLYLGTIGLGALLAWGYLADRTVQEHAAGWRQSYAVRRAAGLYLRDHYPPGTLVALNASGVIPFYSGMPTIDMLGLNDEYIAHHGKRDPSVRYAHQAGDGGYVLSRKPDVVLFGSDASREPGDFISEREIGASTDFKRDYAPVQWPGIGWAYVRRDWNRLSK